MAADLVSMSCPRDLLAEGQECVEHGGIKDRWSGAHRFLCRGARQFWGEERTNVRRREGEGILV